MVRFNRALSLTAMMLVLAGSALAHATDLQTDGRFVVANMAPPEPLPPPPEPAATPDTPAAPAVPEATPSAPESPPDAVPQPTGGAETPPAATDAPLPPPDQSSPPAGMGQTTIIGIIVAIAVAGIGGFWFMRRK